MLFQKVISKVLSSIAAVFGGGRSGTAGSGTKIEVALKRTLLPRRLPPFCCSFHINTHPLKDLFDGKAWLSKRGSLRPPCRDYFLPVPSRAVCPGAAAKAIKVPLGASTFANPTLVDLTALLFLKGLLRQASKITTLRAFLALSICTSILRTLIPSITRSAVASMSDARGMR